MPETLESIGQTLKSRRQEMNLSLREIESATSIRTTHLQAIEEGQVSELISPTYARGFVKQYASFLGLDGDHMIKQNHLLFPGQSKTEYPFGIGTLEKRGSAQAGTGGLSAIAWAIALAAILGGAWFFARYLEVI